MSARPRLARELARMTALSECARLLSRRRPYIDLAAALLLLAAIAGVVPARSGNAVLVSWLLLLAADVALHGVCVWYQLHLERLMQDVDHQ